jgi:predicted transglutaminase-like cysteine proteinase
MSHLSRVAGLALRMACVALALAPGPAGAFAPDLFGYRQDAQQGIDTFPQWLGVLERHLRDDLRDGDCGQRRINRCHMRQWLEFLASIRDLPPSMQLREVNRYANEKQYVLDLDNYGAEDYWATPREFLPAGGDCEDYAITKYFSLSWLGFPRDELRVVVVQDTNLRVPHAVLAVGSGRDIMVLDSQVRDVLPHRQVVHYAPVYSINQRGWWIHTPRRDGA